MTAGETFGPYRLESLLGRGGMGEVHLAFDTEQHRTVALKTLAPHLADDDEFQSRFRREAKNVAKLRNPHVIPIHRYGEIDGRLFIDMRYVEGPDLNDLVRLNGALTPRTAVVFVEQIASALDAAHAAGLVHRDVKPSNVLVDATVDEFVYLVDFGITRSATTQRSYSLTRTGALLGSLDYMAPEQFDGVVSRQSDVYGLTCILFEMLTGTKPYQGAGLAALMHSHLSTPPPVPSVQNPALVPFDEVIAKGMAKVADERYPTAGELAVAARAALADVPGDHDEVIRIPAVVSPDPGSDALLSSAAAVVHDAGDTTDTGSRHALAEPSRAEVRPPAPVPAAAPVRPRGQPRRSPDNARTDPFLRPVSGHGAPPARFDPRARTVAAGPPVGPPFRHPAAPNRDGPPPGLRGGRNTRSAALTLAAVSLVAVTAVSVLAATSDQGAPPLPGALPTSRSAAPPTALPSSPAVETAPAPGAVRQVTFTGRTEDGAAITIVIGNNAAMAYLCDGEDIEAWFRGDIEPDNTVMLENTRTGNQLRATVDPAEALGQITVVGDEPRTFTATSSPEGTGLYEAAFVDGDGRENRIGWVVLGPDDQEGIWVRGNEIMTAPPLDVVQMTAAIGDMTIDGVKKHTGDGMFLGG